MLMSTDGKITLNMSTDDRISVKEMASDALNFISKLDTLNIMDGNEVIMTLTAPQVKGALDNVETYNY